MNDHAADWWSDDCKVGCQEQISAWHKEGREKGQTNNTNNNNMGLNFSHFWNGWALLDFSRNYVLLLGMLQVFLGYARQNNDRCNKSI